MRVDKIEETVELPEGVTATLNGRELTVKGPQGELTRSFRSKRVIVEPKDGVVDLRATVTTKREKMLLRTFRSHIRNMVRGVTEGHEYKLKVCSGHFPMTVTVKDGLVEVKNFIGESVPRTAKIDGGVDVKADGEEITVTGNDKELVARVAGRIENLTRRPGFDTRIFQDGIYIVEKDGKRMGQ